METPSLKFLLTSCLAPVSCTSSIPADKQWHPRSPPKFRSPSSTQASSPEGLEVEVPPHINNHVDCMEQMASPVYSSVRSPREPPRRSQPSLAPKLDLKSGFVDRIATTSYTASISESSSESDRDHSSSSRRERIEDEQNDAGSIDSTIISESELDCGSDSLISGITSPTPDDSGSRDRMPTIDNKPSDEVLNVDVHSLRQRRPSREHFPKTSSPAGPFNRTVNAFHFNPASGTGVSVRNRVEMAMRARRRNSLGPISTGVASKSPRALLPSPRSHPSPGNQASPMNAPSPRNLTSPGNLTSLRNVSSPMMKSSRAPLPPPSLKIVAAQPTKPAPRTPSGVLVTPKEFGSTGASSPSPIKTCRSIPSSPTGGAFRPIRTAPPTKSNINDNAVLATTTNTKDSKPGSQATLGNEIAKALESPRDKTSTPVQRPSTAPNTPICSDQRRELSPVQRSRASRRESLARQILRRRASLSDVPRGIDP